MKMMVTKRFTFEAGHRLPNYTGDCCRFHGHSYKLEVSVSGHLSYTSGMIMDFKELDLYVEPVIDLLDHHDLNDILENPTAENLVQWIVNQLWKKFSGDLSRVRLWETENCYVEWTV